MPHSKRLDEMLGMVTDDLLAGDAADNRVTAIAKRNDARQCIFGRRYQSPCLQIHRADSSALPMRKLECLQHR